MQLYNFDFVLCFLFVWGLCLMVFNYALSSVIRNHSSFLEYVTLGMDTILHDTIQDSHPVYYHCCPQNFDFQQFVKVIIKDNYSQSIKLFFSLYAIYSSLVSTILSLFSLIFLSILFIFNFVIFFINGIFQCFFPNAVPLRRTSIF